MEINSHARRCYRYSATRTVRQESNDMSITQMTNINELFTQFLNEHGSLDMVQEWKKEEYQEKLMKLLGFGTTVTPVSEVSAIAQIRALEHEMFEEVQHKPLPDSDDELQDIDNVIFSGDEDEQISVRVRVGDSPEEVVDVDPTADVVQTLMRALGIKGAACKLLPVDLP